MSWIEKLLKKGSSESAKSILQQKMERGVAEMRKNPSDCSLFAYLVDEIASLRSYISDTDIAGNTTISDLGVQQQQLWQIHSSCCSTRHIFLIYDEVNKGKPTELKSYLQNALILNQNQLAMTIAAILQK